MPETFAHSEQARKRNVRYLRATSSGKVCYEAAMQLRIKEFRIAKGLTVEQLASAVSMSKSFVSELENGRKQINGRRLEAFATFFGVTTTELIADRGVADDVARHLAVYQQLSDEDKAAVERHAQSLLRTAKPALAQK